MSSAKIYAEGGGETSHSKDDEMVWPPADLMEKSLHLFAKGSALRQQCLNLATPNNWFDKFVLFCIVANSVVMAMTDYSNVQGMNPAKAGYEEADR